MQYFTVCQTLSVDANGEASQVKSKGLTGAGILTVAMIARTTYVPVASSSFGFWYYGYIVQPSRHSVAVTDVAAVATAVAATAAIATAAAAAAAASDAVGREINTSSSLKLACEEHEESVIMSRNGLLKLGNRTRGYCSF
ncbi:hypothetical protein HZH68_007647 [Vespula germanica]|uniref:Uncharacterized protein n=1 Tax=Vespula germanica TaxID=30212 RepID=A0A834K833_VESGE|nr:hypothetical protein HZH68_007647 [Vespula germanica]